VNIRRVVCSTAIRWKWIWERIRMQSEAVFQWVQVKNRLATCVKYSQICLIWMSIIKARTEKSKRVHRRIWVIIGLFSLISWMCCRYLLKIKIQKMSQPRAEYNYVYFTRTFDRRVNRICCSSSEPRETWDSSRLP